MRECGGVRGEGRDLSVGTEQCERIETWPCCFLAVTFVCACGRGPRYCLYLVENRLYHVTHSQNLFTHHHSLSHGISGSV